MKTQLIVGDFVVRVKGFKQLVGRKYKVLSITLTDAYLQDVETNRCTNHSIRWVIQDFIKVS